MSGGNPVNWFDPLGLDREVIFWSPLPRPASIFGHVSSRGGNGENYSYGHEGWDRTYPTADKYIQRQTANNNRVGVDAVVDLTAVGRDEATVRNYIRHQEEEDKRIDQLDLF